METEEKILSMIEEIRPYLYMDGGNIEFIKYEDNYLFVRLTGACAHCANQSITLDDGIYNFFKAQIPELEGIINVDL